MLRTCAFVMIAACGTSSPPPPPDKIHTVAPGAGTSSRTGSATAEKRCLPVVSRACGCVYDCGTGERDGERWRVRHTFWKDTELKATITQWCVGEQCTDAFDVEIVCGGICAPKPADPTCHFDDTGACVGAPKK